MRVICPVVLGSLLFLRSPLLLGSQVPSGLYADLGVKAPPTCVHAVLSIKALSADDTAQMFVCIQCLTHACSNAADFLRLGHQKENASRSHLCREATGSRPDELLDVVSTVQYVYRT